MFREPEEGDFLSFEELDSERFYTLMAAVDNLRFQYYLWDEGVGDFVWKEVVNSFEKDPLPVKVSLDFIYEGKDYHFTLHKVIMDESKEIRHSFPLVLSGMEARCSGLWTARISSFSKRIGIICK